MHRFSTCQLSSCCRLWGLTLSRATLLGRTLRAPPWVGHKEGAGNAGGLSQDSTAPPGPHVRIAVRAGPSVPASGLLPLGLQSWRRAEQGQEGGYFFPVSLPV